MIDLISTRAAPGLAADLAGIARVAP